jgi:hypothetical protein
MRQRCFAASGIVSCAVLAALFTFAAAAHAAQPWPLPDEPLGDSDRAWRHVGPLIAAGPALGLDPDRWGSAMTPWAHNVPWGGITYDREGATGSIAAIPAPGTTVLAAISGILIWRRGRSHAVEA